MKEFSDMRAAKVVSPSSDDRVDRLDRNRYGCPTSLVAFG
jgi:hypothetical protein